MDHKATGILHVVGETQVIKDRFSKRDFVIKIIETARDRNYETYAKFQLINAKCDLIDPFNPGDKIDVRFNLRGNEHNGKYYNNLEAWKIENHVPMNN